MFASIERGGADGTKEWDVNIDGWGRWGRK